MHQATAKHQVHTWAQHVIRPTMRTSDQRMVVHRILARKAYHSRPCWLKFQAEHRSVPKGLHEQRVKSAKLTSASIASRVSRSMSVSWLANRCMTGLSPARSTKRMTGRQRAKHLCTILPSCWARQPMSWPRYTITTQTSLQCGCLSCPAPAVSHFRRSNKQPSECGPDRPASITPIAICLPMCLQAGIRVTWHCKAKRPAGGEHQYC